MAMQRRRSIRLRDYDYRQAGAYFVTICSHERRCIFGDVVDGVMQVNVWGQIVLDEWERTGALRSYVDLDAFVVMPNHIHGIIVITTDADGPTNNADEQRAYNPTMQVGA